MNVYFVEFKGTCASEGQGFCLTCFMLLFGIQGELQFGPKTAYAGGTYGDVMR